MGWTLPGPNIAICTIFSAAERYFSISTGDSDSTSRFVEAVTGVILGKIVGRMEVDAQKIANRVVIFGAVEAPRDHPARFGFERPVWRVELALDLVRRHLQFGRAGALLARRRHFPLLHAMQNQLPFCRGS